MFVVWLMGTIFLSVGLFVCVPRYIRFIKCKASVIGTMNGLRHHRDNDGTSTKAYYEYTVNGVHYQKNTGWTSNGIFRVGKECVVKYDPNKPERSYLPKTGQIINCMVGTLFAFAGVGIFICGFLLMRIL